MFRLAPTFDHGAALARNLTDAERLERLSTKDCNRTVAAFVRRASSALYADVHASKPMGTFAAFAAFAENAPAATDAWLERLEAVDEPVVQRVLSGVPGHRMSPVAKEFTLRLLMENRSRLLQRSIP
ncbi:MAG: hypothetical protein HOP29_05575 [Phycisphaerales bacterium]|nr:hypothetical protein [Phycisphaerales bacterium]